MARHQFNARWIHSLKPKAEVKEYRDPNRPNGMGSFGIRVSPKGKKVWFLIYQGDASQQKRISLGTYPDMSLSEARHAANEIIAQTNLGNDPHSERQRKNAAPIIEDLWQAYQEKLSQRKKPKAANTIRQENSQWERIIRPAIGKIKVEDVKPFHLAEIMNSYAKDSPVAANRLHALLSVMFKPAIEQGWIMIHPLQWLDKPGGPEVVRKRFLSDEEIQTLWPFLDQLRRNPRDQLKLGLLTAQRPGEISSMLWADIDFKKAIWTQSNTKTGNVHIVPLSPQVLELLDERKNNLGRRYKKKPSNFIFPTAHNTPKGATIRQACSPIKAVRKIIDESGMKHFTPHDLRRTARTIMSRLEIPHHIRARVLNHSLGRIEVVYDQHDYLREKRVALTKLAFEIERIVGEERRPTTVVKLRAS